MDSLPLPLKRKCYAPSSDSERNNKRKIEFRIWQKERAEKYFENAFKINKEWFWNPKKYGYDRGKKSFYFDSNPESIYYFKDRDLILPPIYWYMPYDYIKHRMENPWIYILTFENQNNHTYKFDYRRIVIPDVKLNKYKINIKNAQKQNQVPKLYFYNYLKFDGDTESHLQIITQHYDHLKYFISTQNYNNECLRKQIIQQLSELFKKYCSWRRNYIQCNLSASFPENILILINDSESIEVDVKLVGFEPDFIFEKKDTSIYKGLNAQTKKEQKENDTEIIHFVLLNYNLLSTSNFLNSKISELRTRYHSKDNFIRLYRIFSYMVQKFFHLNKLIAVQTQYSIEDYKTVFKQFFLPSNCEGDPRITYLINNLQKKKNEIDCKFHV